MLSARWSKMNFSDRKFRFGVRMPKSPARKTYQPIDVGRVRTVPLASRKHKVKLRDFARAGRKDISFSQFMEHLPNQLAARDFREIVDAMISAREQDKPVIWGLGAHVIKCGLSTVVIDLMQRDIINAVALNGAGCIHDVEIA